jgi:hypothetical protein
MKTLYKKVTSDCGNHSRVMRIKIADNGTAKVCWFCAGESIHEMQADSADKLAQIINDMDYKWRKDAAKVGPRAAAMLDTAEYLGFK